MHLSFITLYIIDCSTHVCHRYSYTSEAIVSFILQMYSAELKERKKKDIIIHNDNYDYRAEN